MAQFEIAVVVIAAAGVLVGFVRRSGAASVQRDPQRLFSDPERRAIFARAGDRCEHVSMLGRRCRAAASHADHVHPWSKGGATTLANAQALCARHNLTKGGRVPTRWSVHRLEQRRRRYFPPGVPVAVVWRIGRRRR